MEYFVDEQGIYLKDSENAGRVLAEITFIKVSENIIEINHTFVDESLRGQGIANILMEKVIDYMEENNLKCILTCSYAIKWFEKHPEAKKLFK